MKEKKYNCGVYLIINLVPDEITGVKKVYAGSSINIKSRKYKHFNDLKLSKHHSVYLQRSYDKIKKEYECNDEGMEKYFKFIIIKYIKIINDKKLLKEELEKYENTELDKYKNEDGSIDRTKCYNMRPKAENNLGFKHSEETKQKLREISLGFKHSEESKKKMSQNNKGKIVSEETKQKLKKINLGKKHSEETRKKLSESHKDRKYVKKSEETRKKLSASHKGKKLSEETKKRIGNSVKKYMTEEVRKKMSELANKIGNTPPKPVEKEVINLTTGIKFNSIKEASEFYKINRAGISLVCRGNRKTAGGYSWAYY